MFNFGSIGWSILSIVFASPFLLSAITLYAGAYACKRAQDGSEAWITPMWIAAMVLGIVVVSGATMGGIPFVLMGSPLLLILAFLALIFHSRNYKDEWRRFWRVTIPIVVIMFLFGAANVVGAVVREHYSSNQQKRRAARPRVRANKKQVTAIKPKPILTPSPNPAELLEFRLLEIMKGQGVKTLLHMAALQKDEDQIIMLLEDGADVDGRSERGWTPLHLAATTGKESIAKLLVEHGADVNLESDVGFSPLDDAILGGHSPIEEFLRKHGAKTTLRGVLRMGKGDRHYVEQHVSDWADVNKRTTAIGTPLRGAIFLDRPEIVALLIEHGADIEMPDDHGRRPIMLAAIEGRLECVKVLLKAGANPYGGKTGNELPMNYALGRGHKQVAEVLISAMSAKSKADAARRREQARE
jgi:ankyrin repeat protein